MLIIEWLIRLPRADGILVSNKTVTNASTDEDAAQEAHALWPKIRLRDNQCPDGFQIVDQDGRMMLGRFMKSDNDVPPPSAEFKDQCAPAPTSLS
jgi:hypothetical protein